MLAVLDLVDGFDEFAAGGLAGDLVNRWHRDVVEPDAEIFTAVRSWVDPGAAPDRIPGLVARRAEQWFSGAVDRCGELPGRCGYWLGWQLLGQIVGGEPLETALHWPLSTATARLRAVLCGSVDG
ncbi:hypothetical protein [Plantactinospora sp. WMMB782]|uniref:hypothetical protein n=1 Tax=Plantactinospora sp. WMMB782 TaxID=3404121 RepID=UPI003B95951C